MGRVNNYPTIELPVIGQADSGQGTTGSGGTNSGQDLSVSEDFSLSSDKKLSLKEAAKRNVFYDMWDKAAGDCGTSDRSFGYCKVHEDTYAKLTGDTTNEEAASLTAEELHDWQALVTAASSRQITFAKFEQ